MQCQSCASGVLQEYLRRVSSYSGNSPHSNPQVSELWTTQQWYASISGSFRIYDYQETDPSWRQTRFTLPSSHQLHRNIGNEFAFGTNILHWLFFFLHNSFHRNQRSHTTVSMFTGSEVKFVRTSKLFTASSHIPTITKHNVLHVRQ